MADHGPHRKLIAGFSPVYAKLLERFLLETTAPAKRASEELLKLRRLYGPADELAIAAGSFGFE